MSQKTWYLFLDTTLNGISLGIAESRGFDDDEIRLVSSSYCFDAQTSVVYLSKSVGNLLDNNNLTFGDIDTLVVANGPGSFTGIKIGLAFADGLSRGASREIRKIELSSLECLAQLREFGDSPVAWFLPATQTKGYLAYSQKSQTFLRSVEINIFQKHLVREDGYLFLSDDFLEYKIFSVLPWVHLENVLNNMGIGPVMIAPYHTIAAKALDAMVTILRTPYIRRSKTVSQFTPQYLRKSTPEERLQI